MYRSINLVIPRSLDAVVDILAHEIVHRYLGEDRTNRLDLLDPPEFKSLAAVLMGVTHANRNSSRGRPAQKDFAELVPHITLLADTVPEWPELGYLAARIADSGGDFLTALTYYRRLLPQFQEGKLVTWINGRISDLAAHSAAHSAGPRPSGAEIESLPRQLDYSDQITFVRDSGAEGSVVGQPGMPPNICIQLSAKSMRPLTQGFNIAISKLSSFINFYTITLFLYLLVD